MYSQLYAGCDSLAGFHDDMPGPHTPEASIAVSDLTRRGLFHQGARAAGAVGLLSSPAFLAACGSSTKAAKSTALLTIAHADTPALLDGDQAFNVLAEEIMANCHGGDIVRYAPDSKVVDGVRTAGLEVLGTHGIEGGLAESIKVSKDLKSFEFKLNPDAKSFYGNPITPEAVKWSYDRRRELKGIGSFFMSVMLVDDPQALEIVDKQTVRFHTSSPSTLMLKVNAMAYYGGIFDYTEVKKHVTDADPWAKDFLGRNTAGFGPYHVESYKKGQQLTMVANPNYFGPKPKLDKVIWRVVADSSDRVALLSRGDVDIASSLVPRELIELQKADGVEVLHYPGNLIKSVELNNTRGPLKDSRVRRALAYATPYQQILDSVYFGLGRGLKSPLPEVMPGYTDEFWSYDTNVDAGRKLLREAGYGDGFPLELIYDVSIAEDGLIGNVLRTAYTDLGVKVKLTGVPAAVYADRQNGRKGDAFISVKYPFVPDPAYEFTLYWSSKSSLNSAGYRNPHYDQLVSRMLVEGDEKKRLALAKQVQELWMHEMPWILLANPGYHVAHKPDLTGFTWYGDNQLRYEPLSRA
jgi:peptide/nickel transport system substrate-binding protein